MNEIVTLLRSVSEEDSENILTPKDIRTWLAEYMRMHDAEVARFPTEISLTHWDLLAADYDSSRNAVFVLAIFRDDSVALLAGRGSVSDVRDFGENSFPNNPELVLDDVSRRFHIGGRSIIDRSELCRWLKSDDFACE
jgi:hypothetical protein